MSRKNKPSESSDRLLAELTALRQEVSVLKESECQRQLLVKAINEIFRSLSHKTGDDIFVTISKKFAEILSADYVLIGELFAGTNEVQTIALCSRDKIMDNSRYSLVDSPCHQVFGNEVCVYTSRATELFPKDPLLKEFKVEGYVGVPLTGHRQKVLGILVALYKSPVTNSDLAQTVFQIFASRIAAEVEKKNTETALRLSEEKFRHIVQASPMGIHMYQLEADGRLIFTGANRAADEILGIDNSMFIGKTIEEAFPPLLATEIPEKYRSAAKYNQSWQTEQIEYHEGEITGAFEVYAFQTQPNAMAAMFLDITPRKKAEEDLRLLRNQLSNIINSMPSILIGVDLEGRVTQWNREAETKTGISSKDASGKILIDIFPQLAQEMEKVRLAIQSKIPQKDEKVVLFTGSEPSFTDITVYPLVTNGAEGAVIRLDDVTERVRIEEMMIQSEKMVSVGGLAAGMAHEINNPLAGILQNAQVMHNRLQPSMPRNRKVAEECGTNMEIIHEYAIKRNIDSMLTAIVDSGQRAAKIVQNMLNFSRKSESKQAPSDLADLLDKTIELASNDYDLKKKYDFRKIKINRQYQPDIPKVLCETTKIQQVFLNLLKNGAQAMTKCNSGQPCFNLIVRSEEKWVRVDVEDNGPGMDETVRRRIFEPFFTTKEPGVGTGLGLSVSYFIITENHKGTMTVRSTPGKGTTFTIRLPAGTANIEES